MPVVQGTKDKSGLSTACTTSFAVLVPLAMVGLVLKGCDWENFMPFFFLLLRLVILYFYFHSKVLERDVYWAKG